MISQSRLAIVGVSFRFPGPGGDGFWQALCEGRDLVSTVHESRWARETYLHPRESEPGRSYTFSAGSIGDISGFDAAFFGIAPREAAQIDPQQRLLLELSWEALESGGIRPSTLRGSGSGVLIGFSGSDYLYRHADDLASLDAFVMTGCTASVAANRISYCLDLRGPSMAIDTACSSALTAFHIACRSVLSGECDLAIAGAVNLHLHPLPFIAFSKAAMLSKTGASRAFDAAGDGYVRSEGGAIVILKKLDDAIADGNRIYAVVAGTGVNCNGRTAGLTVPSAEAQTALLKEVYARAGIDPAEVDYVEAHGTGTAVGDPIEARALGAALGLARPEGRPLRIGSVKTNVGHMEAAAGMAGLVKAIYCLQRRTLPRSLHFETPNPRIPFADWNLEVVRELQPLEQGKRLVIGVNSFGFGGANGHAILESAPPSPPRALSRPEIAAPLTVSGHSEAALKAAARAMAGWIREREDLALYDIAYSAALHRDWHEYRAMIFTVDRRIAADALEAFADQGAADALASGRALARPAGPVFVYSGNGSQWAGMGRKLLEEDPVFLGAVAEVDRIFRRHSEHSILQLLRADDLADLLEATEVAQPLLFAIQAGITEMLRGWGIAPSAVLGHSVGEISAAWACGALSLEDAVRIVYLRSAWQGTTRGAGKMTAVRMGEQDMLDLFATLEAGSRLTVAAVNSPRSITVAGAADDIEALESALRAGAKSFSRLALDYAFHSTAMDAIEAGVVGSLGRLTPRAAQLPFHSTVSGQLVAGEDLGAGYWWRNIRHPVRFAPALQRLRESGAAVFVEIGPRPILGTYIAECLGESLKDCRVLPTMAPGSDGLQAIRKRACEVLIAGCPADLQRLFPLAVPYADVPGYPWQREKHWYEPTAESMGLLQRRPVHPLLGYRLRGDIAEWENRLDANRFPACADHRVGGEIVFPAAGFAELALAACAELRDGSLREVEDLTIHAALILEIRHSKTIRLSVDADDGRFAIKSRNTASDEAWRVHATGRLPLLPAVPQQIEDFELPASRIVIAAEAHYGQLAAAGLDYGPAFRTVAQAWIEPGGAAALLASPVSLLGEGAQAQLEPGALDACFQLLLPHLVRPDGAGRDVIAFLPVRIGRLNVLRPGHRVRYAKILETQRGPRSVVASCLLYGEDRKPVAVARDVRFRALPQVESAQLTGLRSRAIPKPVAAAKRNAALPPTETLRAACASRLHGLERLDARRHYYSVVEPLLEAMLCAFAQEALHELAGELSVPAEKLWRLERIRRLAGDAELPAAAEIWAELLANHPNHSGEVLHLGRIGMRLADLVRGIVEIDAPVPDTVEFSEALTQLAAHAVACLPKGGCLRILVIEPEDAETGGRIAAVLDSDRAECLVCADPEALDGHGEPFDIVLLDARAAGDRDRVLACTRRLVADDGLLALLEPFATRTATLARDFLFQYAECGRGTPAEQHATAREHWQRAIGRCGFALQALIEDVPSGNAGPFVVLARAKRVAHATQETFARPPAPDVWLLAADTSSESTELAGRLRTELLRRGRTVDLVDRESVSPAPWKDILAATLELRGGIAGIVELSGLRTHDESRAPRELVDRQIARCESLGALFEACSEQAIAAACWLVTSEAATALLPADVQEALGGAPNADDAPIWGFVRAAANEYPGLSLRLVDLAAPDSVRTMASSLADALLNPDAEDEVILTPFGRFAVRVEADPLPQVAPGRKPDARDSVSLQIDSPGQLKNLYWIRRPLGAPGEDEIEIEVRAAGLNFRDVMFAMGQLSDEALETGFAGATLGMELSGIVVAVGSCVRTLAPGDRVMAFAGASFSTRVITKAASALKLPAAWSFEAGATVPIAFLTAHYALTQLARLHEGERILIHGAAGGVGIAAIQIARNVGAEIFATVGAEAKRDFVRLLGADHVFSSRTLDFAGEVLARTDGKGVDVVLNSLAGEAMVRSLQILRPLGRFLELGKRDYYENSRIGLRPFRNNISYFGIDADQLMRERPASVRRMMRDLIAQFEDGSLSPLPYRAVPAADAEGAFRYMQQSRHIGKIVLRMDPPPKADAVAAARRASLRLPANATYLVTGGLSGFGLRTARWLADKGARHLVLTGRRGVPDAQAADELAALAAGGVTARAEACDVADHTALQHLLNAIHADMPPLRGIVHAAGVIRDGLIRNLDREQLSDVFAPKVLGALNLDRLTRELRLDFFVLYSSATTTFGNAGQANYVAANRFMEVLADARRAKRLPALCVAWGPIEDVGYLARNTEIRKRLVARMGDSAIPSAQALDALEQLLLDDVSGVAVMKATRGSLERIAAASRWARFRSLAAPSGGSAPAPVDSGDLARWLAELDDAALAKLLAGLLKKEAAEILRLPAEKLDAAQPLQDLGFDSLMGVELMTAVEAHFGVSIPVLAVSEIGTIERLAARLVQELRCDQSVSEHDHAGEISVLAHRLASQHSSELSKDEVDAVATAQLRRRPGERPAPGRALGAK